MSLYLFIFKITWKVFGDNVLITSNPVDSFPSLNSLQKPSYMYYKIPLILTSWRHQSHVTEPLFSGFEFFEVFYGRWHSICDQTTFGLAFYLLSFAHNPVHKLCGSKNRNYDVIFRIVTSSLGITNYFRYFMADGKRFVIEHRWVYASSCYGALTIPCTKLLKNVGQGAGESVSLTTQIFIILVPGIRV